MITVTHGQTNIKVILIAVPSDVMIHELVKKGSWTSRCVRSAV
jgi:hypothetical protein